MKKAAASQIIGNPYVRGILEERCPECKGALLGVSDGSGLCGTHGYFEPESGEDRFLVRDAFDCERRISAIDRAIVKILAMPRVNSTLLTDFILRDAASRGISLSVLYESIAHGLAVNAFAMSVILGIDCPAINRSMITCKTNWSLISSLNAHLEGFAPKSH